LGGDRRRRGNRRDRVSVLLSELGAVGLANWLAFIAVAVVTVAALSIVSAYKTDGVWRWRWGNEHD